MPSPILARADALMHRQRQTDTGFDDVPVLTDAIDDDNDIPVLLEAVEEHHTPSSSAEGPAIQIDSTQETDGEVSIELPLADIPPLAARSLDANLREQLASELARRVEQRLATELPRIIESTLRDFLAEQEMIAASSTLD